MRVALLQSRLIAGTRPGRRGRAATLAALVAAALLACALGAVIAQPASADIGETIILRCTHGQSLSGFSQSAYNQALKQLSADTEEYSDCSSLIRQAQLAAAAGGQGGAGTAAGQGAAIPVPLTATPSEQRAITHAQQSGSEPVKVGGGVIHPGVVHIDVASALSSLPTPLLATLAFLLACLLLVVGGALRNRARAGRSD